jgi:hypothetical protein
MDKGDESKELKEGRRSMNRRELKRIDGRIRVIKKAAQELKERHGGIPAVERNAARILASLKMLEINISDLSELLPSS